MSEQIERITKYEDMFREAKKLLEGLSSRSAEAFGSNLGANPAGSAESLPATGTEVTLRTLIDELEAYYTSDVWKQDFADDEAGLLPKDLKRGVLSEDGIYNLLEESKELTGEAGMNELTEDAGMNERTGEAGSHELARDAVSKDQYEALFLEMHPGYFEREYVRAIPEDEPASEMMLLLSGFDEDIYPKTFGEEVTFDYYEGDLDYLLKAVEKVVPHWTQFFGEDSRVYCGFVNGEIASFCQIQDFGEHRVGDMNWKIGGPGCVGTLPEYRNRGIGLAMVRNVTKILKDESYDHSYIHYTYETAWYSKLGYKTFVQWNGKGFV